MDQPLPPPFRAVAPQNVWKKALTGDVASFEQLMQSHYRTLYNYGIRFCADPELVKDTIQDLFLTIWERRAHLNPGVPPKPYLMASLRRLLHRVSLREHPTVELTEMRPSPFTVEFSVETRYIRHESARRISARLKATLDDLPLRQKEVIYLKFYQDLTRGQIATVMDIAPQTVSNLLQIALNQLRKHWKDESWLALA